MTERSPNPALTARIEDQLAEAGLQVSVESSDGSLILSGIVDSEEARQAAEDIVAQVAPRTRIDNQIDVEAILPTGTADFAGEDPTAELPDEAWQIDGGLEPDYTDQLTVVDPLAASGPTSSEDEDAVESGEMVYEPPSDPVVTTDAHGAVHILGGFSAEADDEIEVEPSASDRRPGDEALADAVRRELAEDASTTDLTIHVVVRHGIVHLRGHVPDLDDADNAEAVAARVPGVLEVAEELDVANV